LKKQLKWQNVAHPKEIYKIIPKFQHMKYSHKIAFVLILMISSQINNFFALKIVILKEKGHFASDISLNDDNISAIELPYENYKFSGTIRE
jgi:hypothetical protein